MPEIGVDDRATIRNREIGFIFQSFNLIGDLNVYQNVELPLTYRPGSTRDVAQARRDGGAGARGHGASAESLPVAALGRTAAARRGGARARAASLRSCSRTSRPETWIRRTAKP